jgi:hypothetical protein
VSVRRAWGESIGRRYHSHGGEKRLEPLIIGVWVPIRIDSGLDLSVLFIEQWILGQWVKLWPVT